MVTPSAIAQVEEDEIIVTAQKREQNIQDVPISMQVIDSQLINDLAADDISELSEFIPGLDVGAGSPTQPRYTIRGVTTSDFGVGTEPAVGVYVDGVYSARSGAAVLALGDVERIEVLKGPQGTLFGRNAAAGAVSVVTQKPTQELEGHVGMRLGNYGKLRFDGMLNVPITDTLALRVSGLYNERDGLYTDAATGEDLSREKNWATRAALKWDGGGATNAILTYTHDSLNQDARPAIGIVAIPPLPGRAPYPADPATYLDPRDVPVFNDVVDNHETRDLDEITFTVNHDLNENITLTSISSWRQFETENREDEDGTNRIDTYFDTNNREENESWYQEFRLAGNSGAIDWLVGASYYDESAEQISDTFTFTDTINTTLGNIGFGTPFTDLEYGVLVPNGVPLSVLGHGWREAIFNEGEYKAIAAYADVIWAVNDQLNVTVGGRYTEDDKSFQWLNGLREAPELDGTLAILEAALMAPGLASAFQFDIVFDQSSLAGVACDNGVTVAEGVACVMDRSWNDFSPRAVVDYQLNDDVMMFASFAKGYKAGGFNSVEFASVFDNEDVTSLEAGFKSDFADSGLILNLSGFMYEYNDKQAIRLGIPAGSSIPQYLVETSDDEAWGVDLQSSYPLADGLNMFGNVQYIDATYKRRIAADGTDLSGQPTGEPTWSAALGARYETDTEYGPISMQIIHSYRSKNRSNSESNAQGTTSVATAFETGKARNRTDLRFSWTSNNEKFEWGVYANNIFDNRYVTGVNNLTTDTLGTPFAGISDPMFWGSDIKMKF